MFTFSFLYIIISYYSFNKTNKDLQTSISTLAGTRAAFAEETPLVHPCLQALHRWNNEECSSRDKFTFQMDTAYCTYHGQNTYTCIGAWYTRR